jgi:cold shock CspA family protein
MGETWNKKEREKKRQKNKQDKAEKKLERKEKSRDGNSLDDMMAYLDENGNLTSVPQDPRRKQEYKLEDIEIGVPKHIPLTQEELTRRGRVNFFNDAKGFGFIKDLVTQESVFVHINNLAEPIRENDQVTYEVEMGQRGPNAINVKVVK